MGRFLGVLSASAAGSAPAELDAARAALVDRAD